MSIHFALVCRLNNLMEFGNSSLTAITKLRLPTLVKMRYCVAIFILIVQAAPLSRPTEINWTYVSHDNIRVYQFQRAFSPFTLSGV